MAGIFSTIMLGSLAAVVASLAVVFVVACGKGIYNTLKK